ncbi:hypothetical protein RP20_CCG012838 [Aedes albopictus]|nr:hypothetical protein RP20_CCG012838 [Aedes albopictus]
MAVVPFQSDWGSIMSSSSPVSRYPGPFEPWGSEEGQCQLLSEEKQLTKNCKCRGWESNP